jgi:hypothetical protein
MPRSTLGLVTAVFVLWSTTIAIAKPPSWDTTVKSAAARFKVLPVFKGEAVLDKETGLVWERSPDIGPRDWNSAQFFCMRRNVGNRRGWRLPTIQELVSLLDPSVTPPYGSLPTGHPFNDNADVDTGYWSANTYAVDSTRAWISAFNGSGEGTRLKSGAGRAWCVRGGQGVDPQ